MLLKSCSWSMMFFLPCQKSVFTPQILLFSTASSVRRLSSSTWVFSQRARAAVCVSRHTFESAAYWVSHAVCSFPMLVMRLVRRLPIEPELVLVASARVDRVASLALFSPENSCSAAWS